MSSRRTPSHPEIVAESLRSITPDERPAISTYPQGNAPAWFVALENLKADMVKKHDDHEKKDVGRHQEQNVRLDRLEARVGLLGLIGGAIGSAAPQIFEWLTR